MLKIRLTKNELKRQKDALKMYNRYLPTLILKKQQLQVEIRKVEEKQHKLQEERDLLKKGFQRWIAVFGEDVGLNEKLIVLEEFRRGIGNIAGVSIPLFEGVKFAASTHDLWSMPLWVDRAIEELQRVMLLDLELQVLREQYSLLFIELRTTTQRVNLFEKVKIPETKMYIKKINIYLGDQQTTSVVRGKIAKRGLEKVAG